jgi:hypothetical protein
MLGLETETAVARFHKPGLARFRKEILPSGRPAILSGLLENWPAYGKWTPDFFAHAGVGRPVRIEYGNVLQDEPRHQEWDLGGYMRLLESGSGNPEQPVPYLAYFDIFKTFPELRRDVDYSYWKGRITYPVGWIGPAGSYTGLHYDIADNLFAVFHGSKEFTLYPPDQSRFLYPARRYDIGSVLSEIDARKPDSLRHPLFAQARGSKVTVAAGDVLFTPRGWWHDVLGLSVSISVSCFGFSLSDTLLRGLPGAAKHALHLAGLYRKGECACHMRQR